MNKNDYKEYKWVDIRNCQNSSDIYEVLSQELGFPSFWGRNLDALYDCLKSLADFSLGGAFRVSFPLKVYIVRPDTEKIDTEIAKILEVFAASQEFVLLQYKTKLDFELATYDFFYKRSEEFFNSIFHSAKNVFNLISYKILKNL